MNQTLRLLFLEDSMLDVELCVRELERAGYNVEYKVAQSEDEFMQILCSNGFDVVLADYNFPGFSGMDALREFRSIHPDRPFLIVSGSIGEETAIESIKAGANDYVLKDRLVRLPTAIDQAIAAWKARIREKRTENALRETNEKLGALIQASPLAIIAIDLNGRVQMWNSAAERIFGWRADEVIGKIPAYVAGDNLVEFELNIARVTSGESLNNVEIQRTRRDGAILNLSLSTAPLRDENGQISGFIAIYADMTDKKRAQEERLAMQRQFDEAKRQFYRETILAITDGKLEIVDMPELTTALENIEFSRLLSNASQLSAARHDLAQYLQNCGLNDQRLMDFTLGIGEAMTNALKHAEGGEVFAGCENDETWVAVKDNGPGIDALSLPVATLRRGYSTKPSLGLGYSVILKVCDHVRLNTGPLGTTVVMSKHIKEPPHESLLSIIPDTW